MDDNAQVDSRRIFLLGFMGAGKSTIGPVLANALGFDFVDLDTEIERRIGTPIAQFFNDEGEHQFRAIESGALRDCAQRSPIVVAVGGGAVEIPENAAIMSASGMTIYLKLSVSVLAYRLRHSNDRPMLYDASGVTLEGIALEQRISALLEEREPAYERSDLVVEVGDHPFGHTVERIVRLCQEATKRSI